MFKTIQNNSPTVFLRQMNLALFIQKVGQSNETAPAPSAVRPGQSAEGQMTYEDEVRLGHPALERRCMICNVPVTLYPAGVTA